MASIFGDLQVVQDRAGTFAGSDARAFQLAACSNCSGSQMAVIAYDKSGQFKWLRCVNCEQPAVWNSGVVSPAARPLRNPQGLAGVELAAWGEVRGCLSIGANTAAVMMCRKLLFHIAVANGLPEKDSKERAPSFVAAINQLEVSGLITSKMRSWVDRIKDVGNEANHEIKPVTLKLANDVANFTLQLLLLTYELDALMTDSGSSEAKQLASSE